jgi:hypothetical protein
MKTILIAAAALLAASTANAACYGSTVKTCYDNSGNTYTTYDYGNGSYTSGHNSRTGSSWSQQSDGFGNTYGTDASGDSWSCDGYGNCN